MAKSTKSKIRKYIESKPLMKNAAFNSVSAAALIRNAIFSYATFFTDLWVIALGVVAFLHLISVEEVATVWWLALNVVDAAITLTVNAWQHGVLRAQAERFDTSTGEQVKGNAIFKGTLIRMLIDQIVLNFVIFIYVYTKDTTTVIHSIPSNGIWTFTNAFFSITLLLQLLSGVVRLFMLIINYMSNSKK